jgi:hypothetical protein
VVRVQENLYYQEHGVINYSVPSLFTSVNDSLSATVIDFSSRIVDPRGLVETGAAWKFTSPRARVYNIRVLLQVSASAASGDDWADAFTYVSFATTGGEVVGGFGNDYPYIVYSSSSGTPPPTTDLAAGQLLNVHYHNYADYSSLLTFFNSPPHTLSILKNGVALPAEDVFSQDAYVSVGAQIRRTSAGTSGILAVNGPFVTGWIEATISLDTNDSIQVTQSYDYSPIIVTDLGGADYQFLKYNATGKAYIFITEVSKRT